MAVFGRRGGLMGYSSRIAVYAGIPGLIFIVIIDEVIKGIFKFVL
jgi:hypothetical protein